MIVTTKIYDKYQTVIPKEIRKNLGITKNHIVEWIDDKDGTIKVNFRKKLTTTEMIGRYTVKKPFNSTEELKRMERGEINDDFY